jgi:hypothetical protein
VFFIVQFAQRFPKTFVQNFFQKPLDFSLAWVYNRLKKREREVIKMRKTIVFDMDGTIADFYGVNGWLEYLKNEDTTPYREAKPLYNMDELRTLLINLKEKGWKVVVTTWLAKGGTKEYNNRTRLAKLEWLAKYNFPYDEIHLVKYGTTKANCTRKIGGYQVLVDDNETVRKGWTLGATINANENILEKIAKIV